MSHEHQFARGKREETTGGGTERCDTRTLQSLRCNEKSMPSEDLPHLCVFSTASATKERLPPPWIVRIMNCKCPLISWAGLKSRFSVQIYNFRRSRICFTLAMSTPMTIRHSIPDAVMAMGAEKRSAHIPNAEDASGIRAWSSW